MCTLEELSGSLLKDRRSEWAESLAKLYFRIDLVLHRRVAGIGQDAAVSERARAKLGTPLVPSDDSSVGNQPGDLFCDRCRLSEQQTRLLDSLVDLQFCD